MKRGPKSLPGPIAAAARARTLDSGEATVTPGRAAQTSVRPGRPGTVTRAQDSSESESLRPLLEMDYERSSPRCRALRADKMAAAARPQSQWLQG